MGVLNSLVARFLLTAAVALLSGSIAVRLGVPVGGLVGGLFGVVAFNIITNMAYAPDFLKLFTQSLSGAYIGMRIKRSDLPHLRVVLAPAAIMLLSLLAFNITIGVVINSFTDMSLITALLSTTPGGVTEISLMSAEMGANQAHVTLMHLLRLTSVLGMFPIMLRRMAVRFGEQADNRQGDDESPNEEAAPASVSKTLAIAFTGGTAGYLTGLPAGTLAFSMVAVAAFNVRCAGAFIQPRFRPYVQMMAGLIIGKGVTFSDLLGVPGILLPAAIMIVGYFALNIGLSFIIHRYTKMDYTTALFSTSPAGPSDMALMAMELGGDAPKVACMQMMRVFATILLFPIAIQLAVKLLGG